MAPDTGTGMIVLCEHKKHKKPGIFLHNNNNSFVHTYYIHKIQIELKMNYKDMIIYIIYDWLSAADLEKNCFYCKTEVEDGWTDYGLDPRIVSGNAVRP